MRYLIIVLSLFLITCGGGGGGSPTEPEHPSDTYFWLLYGTSADDSALTIVQASDGSYIIGGNTNYYSDYNIYLVQLEYNQDDGVLYYSDAVISGRSAYIGKNESLKQTMDGSFIIAGTCNECGANNINTTYAVRANNDGSVIWATQIGQFGHDSSLDNSSGHSIIQDSSGNFLMVGSGWPSSNHRYGTFVKLDASGSVFQQFRYDASHYGSDLENDYSNFTDILPTNDNAYMISGYKYASGSNGYEIWLIKIDGNGNKIWDITIDNSGSAYAIDSTNDGGYIIVGSNGIFRVNSSGDLIFSADWDSSYNSTTGTIYSESVRQTLDGGYIIAGGIQNYAPVNRDAFLLKVRSDLSEEWMKIFGDELEYEMFYSVKETMSGGYIAVGVANSSSGNGGSDIYIEKVNSSGVYE